MPDFSELGSAAKKFFGLLHNVPLKPVTGTAAANVLKGQDMQKATDLARQLQSATNQGVRGGALKAVQENAVRQLTGGDPNKVISRASLGDQLKSPLQLVRVDNRQDMLPERWQQRFGMQENPANFEPDEEWVNDRANELLSDWFYNSGETYDHGEVMKDVRDSLHDYVHSDNPARSSWGRRNNMNALHDIAESYDLNMRPDYATNGDTEALRNGFRSAFDGNRRDALANLSQAGVIPDHNATAMIRDLENSQGMKYHLRDNDERFDPILEQTNLFDGVRENHEDSWREAFEENNYSDAQEAARREAQEGGHGEATEYETEPYRWAGMQRLGSRTDPSAYTEQNVFSFSPTGLALTRNASKDWAYRMSLDPDSIRAALTKMQNKRIQPNIPDVLQGYPSLEERLMQKALDEPGSATIPSHYPEFTPPSVRSNYLGHFRGSMNPGDAFLLEELQSDPAQTYSKMGLSKAVPASLQDWVGQMGPAALQHAASQGATSFHVPTARAVESLRGSKDYGWLYDKAIPQDVLTPIAKHYDLPIQDTGLDNNFRGTIPTRSIDLPDDVRQDIMDNGVPYRRGGLAHFAGGGDVPDLLNDDMYDPSYQESGVHADARGFDDVAHQGRFAYEALRGIPAGVGGLPHDALDFASGMSDNPLVENTLGGVPHHVLAYLAGKLPSADEIEGSRFYPPHMTPHNDMESAINSVGTGSGEIGGSLLAGGSGLATPIRTGAKTLMKLARSPGELERVLKAVPVLPARVAHADGGPVQTPPKPTAPPPVPSSVTGRQRLLSLPSGTFGPTGQPSFSTPAQLPPPHAEGGTIRMPHFRTAATAPSTNDPIIGHLMRWAPRPKSAPAPIRYDEGGQVSEPSFDELVQAMHAAAAEHDEAVNGGQ